MVIMIVMKDVPTSRISDVPYVPHAISYLPLLLLPKYAA